jgi:hypothetical protein
MKAWMSAFSVASALLFAFACADDDKPTSDSTGGAGGEAGAGDTGGTASTGGSKTTGGSNTGGSAGEGSGGADSGGGGQGGAPIMCHPPEPPVSGNGDAGGAGGAAGAGSVAGAAGDGAGGNSAGGAVSGELAIEGRYSDGFGGHQVITGSSWTSASDFGGAVYHIASYSNREHWIVARNDQTNDFNPCLWSRFDWTEQGGVLYYCQTAFAADSEEAARAVPASDASDPATKGCGGSFPWSVLTPE